MKRNSSTVYCKEGDAMIYAMLGCTEEKVVKILQKCSTISFTGSFSLLYGLRLPRKLLVGDSFVTFFIFQSYLRRR